MNAALAEVIRMYPGLTMACIVFFVVCFSFGVASFLENIGRRRG